MSIEARREYLLAIRERYLKANRREKALILNEFCNVCGYDRKYAIKLINSNRDGRNKRPGPQSKYDDEVIKHLVDLWNLMDRLCSKNMKAALPLWLPFYKGIDERCRQLLLQISASTIDRSLKPYRRAMRRGLSSTKPSLIKNRIPIELLDKEITEPGSVEADTVAHCGPSLLGTFVNSITVTDLYSSWTENRALMGKTSEAVIEGLKSIEKSLPFILTTFASDSGSEFVNHDVHFYLQRRPNPVKPVRRRPYKKNDNAHVEQKNWTHVRELFGYERIETKEILDVMNDIYENYWSPLKNFFTPAMKLKKKTRIGGKLKKEYDEPKTPYQRLLDHPNINPWAKGKMNLQYSKLNPFEIKQELERKLNFFFRLVDIEKRKRSQTGS